MTGTRLIVTAINRRWVEHAVRAFCGYASSVIGCDLETGVERWLASNETPDGRPGASVLAFAFSRDRLETAVANRTGQCLLTCATSAVYDGFSAGDRTRRIKLGDQLRFFGDGFQQSKVVGERRVWRLPTMDGEFVCEDSIGTFKGVAGGNLLIVGCDQRQTLAATEACVEVMEAMPDVILPFPGGLVRSGSKVGSRYPALKASTNEAYCPTLRGLLPQSALPPQAGCVYEIVIDGVTVEAVSQAMAAGLATATHCAGVIEVSAGNYGGKLGPYHLKLADLLPEEQPPEESRS